ncbi:hypothetical protein MMPV_003959 [Pyropia vietnamensis]
MAFVGGSPQLPPLLVTAAVAAARPGRCCWVGPRPAAAAPTAAAPTTTAAAAAFGHPLRRLPVLARPAAVGRRGRCAPRAAAAGSGGSDELYPEPEPYVPPPPTVPGRSGGEAPPAPARANRWTSPAAPATPSSSSSPSAPYVVPPGGTPGYTSAPTETDASAPVTMTGASFDTASASASLWRFGWIAWWSQFVLTTIAGVILVFSFAFPGVIVATSASKLGTLLAAIGVATGLVSNVWTYGYTRLSLSLGRAASGGEGAVKAAAATAAGIRNRLRVGVFIALTGLTVSLLGVQAIVGTLLARLLSSGLGEAYGTSGVIGRVPGGVQPVDILVVQAAANGMLGLVCALGVSLWLSTRVNKWAAGVGGKAK